MTFFPHKVSPTNIGQAVSASKASSSLFISNFANLNINTASLGLNISGSPGSPGTNFTRTGTKGPDGFQGEKGFRGDNAYLLSASWSRTAPVACNPIYDIKDYCGGGYTLYYSNTTSIPGTTGASTVGINVYFDSDCNTQVLTVPGNTWSHASTGKEITVTAGALTIDISENCDFCKTNGQTCVTGDECCSGICQFGFCVAAIEGDGGGGIVYCNESTPCPEGYSCVGGSCVVFAE